MTSMLRPARACAALLLLLSTVGLALPQPARALLPLANASGDALYQRECAPCHGPAAHGDGPEAPTFRNTPRDFGDLARVEPPSARIVERVRRSRLRMLEIDEAVVVERRKRMVEELVGHLRRMPDVPWPVVRRGADVYAERCEKCHGPNGRPVTVNVLQRGPQPTGLQPPPDFQKAHGDPELIAIARGQGHPAMPGFAPVMNDEDARALLAYLRLLSNGFAWYSLWCAGCHGDEGRGDGPLATGIDQPHVVFDRAYLSAQSPSDLRHKAMHVFNDVEPAAPHFQRNLSEGQARAVLAAVRALQAGDGGRTPGAVVAAASPAATAAVAAAPTVVAARAPVEMPAAVATMLAGGAPAATPAPPTLAGFLAQQAAPRASVAGAATPLPAVAAAAGAATPAPPSAIATATPPGTRPVASAAPASATPAASRTPAPARTPGAKAAKPKAAAAKAAPAKKPVKPKATPVAKARPKAKAKPTPAKKPPAARATPTPGPELAP